MTPDQRAIDVGFVVTRDEAVELIEQGRGYTEDANGCWLYDVPMSTGFGPFLAFYECSPPESLVWAGDFTFKPIGSIRPGEEVIGWSSRPPAGRQWLGRAKVERVIRQVAPLVELQMESGSVIRCTSSHKWWCYRRSVASGKVYAKAKVGRDLCRVVDIPKPLSRAQADAAAWLGGLYDGEGSKQFISQQAGNQDVRDAMTRALTELDVEHTMSWQGANITGGLRGYARFAALCKPVRYRSLEPRLLGARFGKRDRVVSIEHAGVGEVVSLQTSTGNYVVNGYASKNCIYDRVPQGFEVFHVCQGGRRGCVRPSHLDLAPAGSRMRDVPDPSIEVGDRMAFAKRLRDEREARSSTRGQFAKELGVAASTLGHWEDGVHQPADDMYRQIARQLGWDGRPRRWMVTVVHQRVVVARSSGDAVREALEPLRIEGEQLKTAVHSVRSVA
jgi:DNA-binding XRE family transcriptional regulator